MNVNDILKNRMVKVLCDDYHNQYGYIVCVSDEVRPFIVNILDSNNAVIQFGVSFSASELDFIEQGVGNG